MIAKKKTPLFNATLTHTHTHSIKRKYQGALSEISDMHKATWPRRRAHCVCIAAQEVEIMSANGDGPRLCESKGFFLANELARLIEISIC